MTNFPYEQKEKCYFIWSWSRDRLGRPVLLDLTKLVRERGFLIKDGKARITEFIYNKLFEARIISFHIFWDSKRSGCFLLKKQPLKIEQNSYLLVFSVNSLMFLTRRLNSSLSYNLVKNLI